ncbi:probable WRKY transcription factor 31 [Selaginella moellendorffii]|nr:probable WRKY transcription factor 31 [Selaginella moellendorffii]|eukprot:XP_002961829.2 probable WRKY transcription factor 31 [Selaginella moellendorffii]
MDQQQNQEQSSSSSSYQQLLKSEVSKGCAQVRQFEQKLHSLIQSPAFYPTLIFDATAIISTFANVIAQLNRGDPTQAITAAAAAAAITIPTTAPSLLIRPSLELPTVPSSSTASSSPMTCSPIRASTPPHSPPNLALSSPHTTSSSSPALTPSTTPEGSPNNPPCTAALDGAAEGGGAMDEFPASGIGRKRKCLPKRVVKQRANSNEHGSEAPADDGFTWRKYGQKDILNSKFPRSYYRCTHQKELGCQATKYVQKCEDEPSMYQVTYIGEHSCQNAQNNSFWMRSGLSARPLLFSMNPGQSAAAVAASLTLPSSGIHSTPPSLASRLEEMSASRLTLSPSRPSTTGFNLLRPAASLTSPSQWTTPRFGVACPVKSEPLAAPPLQLATTASQQEPSPSSLDTDRRLLRMSLGSSMAVTAAESSSLHSSSSSTPPPPPPPPSSSSPVAATTTVAVTAGEHENIQELWNLGELPEVGMDTASLEDIPKRSSSLTDIAYLQEIMGYDPMLFESDN